MRYIIGDVHGCREELEQLCDLIYTHDSNASFLCVGDLVNKGPDSEGVLRVIQERNIQSVLGNHDLSLVKILNIHEAKLGEKQKRILDHYRDPQAILAQLMQLPLWIQFNDALIVHAGLEPGKSALEEMQTEVLTSIRFWDPSGKKMGNSDDSHWYDCVSWPTRVFFGHWAVHGLMMSPKFVCLDSGCVYGKELTAICIEDSKIFQIKANKVHCQIK